MYARHFIPKSIDLLDIFGLLYNSEDVLESGSEDERDEGHRGRRRSVGRSRRNRTPQQRAREGPPLALTHWECPDGSDTPTVLSISRACAAYFVQYTLPGAQHNANVVVAENRRSRDVAGSSEQQRWKPSTLYVIRTTRDIQPGEVLLLPNLDHS